MKIVLVMLENIQSYIIDNIDCLLKHNNNDIVVITNEKYTNLFENYSQVEIIIVENIIDSYNSDIKNKNRQFRNGFWFYTSYRFISIYEYMKKYQIKDIIHIENDVLVFKDMDTIDFHNKDKILLTMDALDRCIPGIMFIPNSEILYRCIQEFKGKTDMDKWAYCYNNLDCVDNLPIINEYKDNNMSKIVSNHFAHYQCIFDAAAIGQYLGGIDPRNANQSKRGVGPGFINGACIVKYNNYKFVWKEHGDMFNPFIIIDDKEYPIVNLHIHNKNLKQFVNGDIPSQHP